MKCDLRNVKWEMFMYNFRSVECEMWTVEFRVKCEFNFSKNGLQIYFGRQQNINGADIYLPPYLADLYSYPMVLISSSAQTEDYDLRKTSRVNKFPNIPTRFVVRRPGPSCTWPRERKYWPTRAWEPNQSSSRSAEHAMKPFNWDNFDKTHASMIMLMSFPTAIKMEVE